MFTRFKHWLIKKLGGVPISDMQKYQANLQLIEEFNKKKQCEFITLYAGTSVPARDYLADSDFCTHRAERELMEKIIKEMTVQPVVHKTDWMYDTWTDNYLMEARVIIAKETNERNHDYGITGNN